MGANRRAPADPLVGRDIIGQYRIVEKLGSGGMGAVYRAEQITMGRSAVIKVLHSRLHGSTEMAARFAIEAKAASSLQHPNIVTIYNYGEMEDGTLYLAMEHLEGQTLADLLRAKKPHRLPLERAVPIALQIANALGEAHRRGVVHRDLKPSNIMLVERAGIPDFVKVLDFGIAKLEGGGVTSTGEVFGTPRYMSPEQLRGMPLDGRSDVYSLGLLLYEMLAGRSPFASDTPQGWMFQHIGEPPPPPTQVCKKLALSPAVEAVILRALAKAPAERPPTMDAFAHELDAALRTAPKSASQPTAKRRKKARAPKQKAAPLPLFARMVRPFRRARPKGWRGFVASTRGRLAIAAVALGIAGIALVAASSGSAPASAAAAVVEPPPAVLAPAPTPPAPSSKPAAKKRTKPKGAHP